MTRKVVFTALSIGLLIVCIYFFIDTMSQKQEQAALKTQITDVIKTIDQIPQTTLDLEQRLADIQADVENEQERFLSKINSTEAIDTFREIADMHSITISWLSTTPWSQVNIGEYEYLILGISLDMEGTLANLMTFVDEIESDREEQFHIQYLDITNNDEEISSSGPVSANLDLAVYAHPPITN